MNTNPCIRDVCVTCSDAATPAYVIELLPARLALVDTGEGLEEVSVALVEARVGDVVLVHAREAIALIPPAPGPPNRPEAAAPKQAESATERAPETTP